MQDNVRCWLHCNKATTFLTDSVPHDVVTTVNVPAFFFFGGGEEAQQKKKCNLQKKKKGEKLLFHYVYDSINEKKKEVTLFLASSLSDASSSLP